MTEFDNYNIFKHYSIFHGEKHDEQHAQEIDRSFIALVQRDAETSFQVSANTLAMIETSINNLKAGIVSDAINLSEFREQARLTCKEVSHCSLT